MSDGAKEVLVTFRCNEHLADAILKAASERDMSKSEFIRTSTELFMLLPFDREIVRERSELYRKIFVILEKV